ncbi:hypothetical protein PCYB_142910 [Plasmodium cynomolgi strain B]|uniref:Golgi protein 1 n=1 Tax=Plasmodium cynomolgi (strain B) TaxID=1120755 RepID=K6UMS6_PLACD|nr:hypothetical protein PCYB_142910 [Plasmodium cynomolgi strain B]GAB68863.1 hypothetical protein PCYB_142910 [Plasmodium cynomolgi strain B]
MMFAKLLARLAVFSLTCWLQRIHALQNECDFNFNVSLLSNIYDKYNGKQIDENEGSTDYCTNLESLNSLKSFWQLKLKSICTEETSILDKQVFNNICSKTYKVPHVTVSGLEVGNDVVNIEFFCAHFLYSNNKEIIKCVRHNILNNYLDSYHIAFDLSVSQELLKQSNHVDDVLNLKNIEGLALTKRIIDDSVCRIHSSVHTIMNKHDFELFKALAGLCTKLGFHNHFIITDNIHPLTTPIFNEIPYSLNSLNFNIQNSTMYYTNYEYFVYNVKLADIDHVLGSYMSPSALAISKNNSYVTWLGLNKDNTLYKKKFTELYNLLDNNKYIERIVQCYSKYTSKYYGSSVKYFLRYIPENKRDVMQNNPKIFVYIINGICKNIPSIHKCVEKIIFLDGIYDLYFKNFMINFIYYNAACIFNCNPVDLGKIINDEQVWDILDIPTKIENYYKYYYEIKKKLKTFDKYDEEHYKMLIKKSKEDPDVFSKIDIEFSCTRMGKWPIRGTTGRWLSDVLCETKLVPQLVYNYEYAEKQQKKNKKKNEIDTNLYTLKENTRLIGMEFEDQEPFRCAISYLGDENKKTHLPVSATLLVHAAIGFCTLHGFKIVWLADSAFDIHTNVYLRYTSILEQGQTYYEQSNFEIYGQTRLIAQLEYIASGMNVENNLITSGTFKNRYNMISYPGADLQFMLLMSKKVKETIYNLKFDCHSWEYKGCSEYYPLMKKNKKIATDEQYNTIKLNGKYSKKELEEMYECAFMHDKTFQELNKMFPKECTFGSRIGECHKKVRKHIPCYNEQSCKYLLYIYENFYKPQNHVNLLNEHFIKVSENLTKMSRPYYLQSILALEHDIQIKKSKKMNTQYEDIVLFILKNSIFYVSWVTSSEYWKRAVYVQDTNTSLATINQVEDYKNREKICPVAYGHEFIGHMLVQYMKFPNDL